MYPPRTGKVVRFAGDSPVEVHTPSAAAAGSEASEAQPQHGVYLHSGASLDGSNLSAAGEEEEEEELEEDWGEEGEETWYYGAETYTRGWRHVENQIVTWVALLVIAAIALNLRLSFEYQDRSSAGTRGVPVPPPPSMPPPPFPPTPPQPPPFVPPRSPPNSSLPPPTAVLRPPPTAVLRPPAPLPPPTPFPPPRTGWSDWLGRETPQSTIGICPCSAHINSWKVWVEQGLQATPQDTSPISGMTGTCSGPGGLSASVEVFPGTGAADTTLAVPGNWSAVYGQSGTYLDSWLGVGGSGPTPFAWSCLPGELVTGLHVAWEASAAAGTNIATGLRVYCENPNTCGGGTVPVPAQGGVPPPAAEQQPPPAAQQQPPPAAQQQPPPAAQQFPPPAAQQPPPPAAQQPPPTAVLRPPAPLPPPTPFPPPRTGWSDWLGRETPQSTIGICPCSAHINSWKVWVEQGLQATPQDTSPISGMTGTCSGPGGLSASVEVFPGTGAADTTLAVPGNWSAVYGQSGTYLDSWLGVGGSGPTPFAWSCLPGELVTGLHVAWEASAAAGTNIATGLRVYCENPNTCGGGTVPVPAQGGVPPPAAEQQPPPAAQQQQPPPAAAVLRPPPAAPVDASNWSPWVGAGTGPGDYAGLCPCGTYVQSWNLWSDPAYAGPDGSTGALSGLVAQCSGVDAQSLQVFPGSTGAATNALLNIEGFTGMTGQYGSFIASLNDVGGTAPQRFNYQCPGGNKVTGIDVDTQVQNGTEYIAGLRFYCGNAPQCPALPPSPPPTPLQAAAGAPPPVALARPPPLPSPRLPPPAPETPPDFSTTEGPSPEASPAPTPSPGPSGLPAGTWTDWVGSTAGPGDYGGVCSCGTHIASWNTWDDPAFVGPEGENGAIIGVTATCSGPDQLVVEPLMGPGAPTDSISNPAGYTAVTGQYGKYFTTFLGMGTPGPRNFTAGCPGGLLVSGFAMDTDTVGGRELVTGMQFLCGDTVDCGGTIVVPEPPAPPALGTPPPAPPTQPLPLPPGSWSTYFGGTANPAAAPNTRVVEAACPCGQYINAFYIWVDEQYLQGAENGRLRGITADCNAGSSIKVFPGDGAPSQSNLQPDGFSGMDGEYGTYLNDINRLGPSSGPQTFQFYCPVGEKLLGYSVAVTPDAGTDYASGIRFYCGTANALEC
ncbi:hypothetical protein D9Q98_000869 [Chlorella vulgaris]|uniref:Uncharacterized protein n=1 Tax=Chlorella vulgaris TaxID=3077 RepID=A0A9D4TZ28_CHLVU|nr:hypothetical protein D9Q98_000869 [Chlorella vulgaris]